MHAKWFRRARRGTALVVLTAAMAVLPAFSAGGSTGTVELPYSEPVVSLTSSEWSATMAARYRLYYAEPESQAPAAEQTEAVQPVVAAETPATPIAPETVTTASTGNSSQVTSAQTARTQTQNATKSFTDQTAAAAAAASTAPAAAPAAQPAPEPAPAPAPEPAADEQAQAQALLNSFIAKYPILAGSTVSFGDAKGRQAICYYQSGRIVISATHTASLSAIMSHEVGHILDWRDNGVIDWGESIPAL